MKLSSTSYFSYQFIPLKYCSQTLHAGQNLSPQFSWTDYPPSTKSFLLTFIDRHPKAKDKVHWFLADIPASINKLVEGASNSSKIPADLVEMMNGFDVRGYTGPEPPKNSGTHVYEAIVYALDTKKTGLSGQLNEKKILAKIKPHILAQANYVGKFTNS
jgi:Raf kinase inhibitor-like YbhB/YbcL family protein